MMELIRTWLISVTAAALIAALADCLTPDGAIKKVGKLAGGLLLMITILQPVLSLDQANRSEILTRYSIDTEGYSNALETENISLMKAIIEEETAAYIQDKARELAIACTAAVTCRFNEEGMPYPANVLVCGEFSPTQITQLTQMIEEDLAIPAAHQRYERISDDEG